MAMTPPGRSAVFAIRGDGIAAITGFPHDLEVFAQLGLPATP